MMDNPIGISSSRSIGGELTVQGEDGKILRASFRGCVQPKRSVTITVDISGMGAEATDYADEIHLYSDEFFGEVRTLAAQNGVPV